MQCSSCLSKRVAHINGKCNDCFSARLDSVDYDGYVPTDLGIGGGDEIGFNFCLDCGKIQGKFPLPPCALESKDSNEEIVNFYLEFFSGRKAIDFQKMELGNMKEYTKYMSLKFQGFIQTFLSCNRFAKMPSEQEFLNMYLNNDCYVGE